MSSPSPSPSPSPVAGRHSRLTLRELEILELVAQGSSAKLVAGHLGISICTVNNHLAHIYQKLNVHNVTEALWRTGFR